MARRAAGPALTCVIRAVWPATSTRRGLAVSQVVPGEQVDHVDIIWYYIQEMTAEIAYRGAVVSELEWSVEKWR